jgi:hypothetical protein
MSPLRAPAELLQANGIQLADFSIGRHYATCPRCSATRKTEHRKAKCLGVSIEAGDRVGWGCNHCGWTGPHSGNGNGGGQPLASYVYRDKSGAERFRKVRNEPGREPRFFIQKWDGAEWARGKEANAKIKTQLDLIYRADEIAKAVDEGRTILVVEGEKDVDNVRRLGFVATCNAHGAAKPGQDPSGRLTIASS